MRSDRDNMVRYRAECKRLQAENHELKRSRTVIQGIPERQHNDAIKDVEKLKATIARQSSLINELNQRKVKKTITMNSIPADVQLFEREKEKLTAQLSSARRSLVSLANQKNAEIKAMQGRINQLESTLRNLDGH